LPAQYHHTAQTNDDPQINARATGTQRERGTVGMKRSVWYLVAYRIANCASFIQYGEGRKQEEAGYHQYSHRNQQPTTKR
jgi:hypothetical protein